MNRHVIPLSRPASPCGGLLSLEFLVRKLARFGESEALITLLTLSIPMSARVRWTLYGNALTVEVSA